MLDALPVELLWLVLDAGTVWVSRATARTCRRLRDVVVHHSRRLMARLAARVGVDAPRTLAGVCVPRTLIGACVSRTRVGVCVRHARIVLRIAHVMSCYDAIAATWDADGVHLTYSSYVGMVVFNVVLNIGTFDRVWSVPRGRYAPGHGGTIQGAQSAVVLIVDDTTVATRDHDTMVACRVPLYCARPRDPTAAVEACEQLLNLTWHPWHIEFHKLERCSVVGHVDVPPRALLRDVRRLRAIHMSPPKGSWTSRCGSTPLLWLGLAADGRARKVRRSCGTARPSAQDAGYALLCGERPDDGGGCRWIQVVSSVLKTVLCRWAPVSDSVGLSLADSPDHGRVLRMRFRLRCGIGSTDVWMSGVVDE